MSAQTPTPLGGLPLYFEANCGQVDASVQFLAHGRDSQFLISPAEGQIVLRKEAAAPVTVRMQFMGANSRAQIRGDAELSGKINYLVGNDPAQWHTGVPTFGKVRIEEIYPGIGLVYYGNQQQLEYDFQVAPGANPGAIKIHFDGVDKIAVNAQGELVLDLSSGEIRQPKPVMYQMVAGARREISGGYRLVDAYTVAFAVGNYDRGLPLVIDPILSYSTYFGGNYGETAWAVAINTNDGSIYMAGETFSTQFTNWPVPPGAYQTNYHGGQYVGDAFVARFGNLGTNLIYLTYLGGSGNDRATSIAVDNLGDAYVTGYTDSTNFPVTNSIPGGVPGITNSMNISGTLNKVLGYYPVDAFVVELNPGGSNLIYSTYLGGSAVDGGNSIAVDLSGNAYVTGFTYSTNFPTTTNAMQRHFQATNNSPYSAYFNANAFVVEIAHNGANLNYASYLGGTNFDEGTGIAVDNAGSVYVTGFTASTNFPIANAVTQQLVSVTFTTNSAPTNQVYTTNFVNGYLLNGSTNTTGNFDAFVAKFNPSFAGRVYSTFLGGTNNDIANSIAVDSVGNAYVTGWTVSTNFPNTVTIPNLYNGLTNNAYFGYTTTTNAFLTQITWNGTNANIGYSTVFGGTNFTTDIGYGVAVDPAGNAFVVGTTSSTNFPTFNVPAFTRSTNSGLSDAFVIAFNTNASTVFYSTYLGGNDNDFGYGIALDTNDNAYVVGTTSSTNFPTSYARQTTRNGTNDAFLAEILFTVQPPEITTQPTNQLVGVGATVTFAVTATGTPPLTYQWQVQGTNLIWTNLVNGGSISGATNNILTITDAQTNNSGNYLVIVTNYAGSVTSSNAVLTVTNAPVITGQPTNQTVGVGSTVKFNVSGNATPPFFLQWLKDGTDLMDGTNTSGSIISGSTGDPLTISNAQTNDDGNYWIVITNNWGSVTSSVATLTVLQTPLFGSIIPAGGTNGGFILSGGGGTNSGTYYVLTTTNLTLPLTNWTPIASNQFDSLGGFTFTNAAQTNAPQMFYILKLP